MTDTSAPGARRRPRTAKQRLALAATIAIASVASLAALEGLVRLLHLAPPIDAQHAEFERDPDLIYRGRANAHLTGRSASDEFDFDYRHNSLGFRDVEHALEKPPSVYRIVTLGDSFTYGAGAAFDDTWPRRVERLLNERLLEERPLAADTQPSRRVEVINLALPRHFPAVERRTLERFGLSYRPDLVVVGFAPNDVIDTYLGVEAIAVDDSGFLVSRRAERLGSIAPWLYLRSHVLRIVLRRIAEWLPAEGSPHSEDIHREHGFHEPDWRAIESELDAMRRIASEHGAGFGLVSIPQRRHDRPEHAYADTRLGRWSAERDVLFVPVRESMLAAGADAKLYWERDGHCTGAGYEVVARALTDALLRSRWAP